MCALPAEPLVWQGADYGEAKVFPLQVMNSKSLIPCRPLIWQRSLTRDDYGETVHGAADPIVHE